MVGLAIFSLARIGLYITYYDKFAMLTLGEVAFSFIHGMRFDAAILFIPLGVCCTMLLIPFKVVVWRKIWLWFAFVLYVVSAVFLITDVVYFGYVGRHFANELYFISNELDFVVGAVREYIVLVVALIVFIIICAFFFRKLTNAQIKSEKYIWLKVLVALIISFIFIRGSFSAKPVSTIDAYKYGTAKGNIMMNGVFSTYKYRKKSSNIFDGVMSYEEALQVLNLEDSRYPLLKTYQGREEKLNIVILVMESWSAYYMGVMNPDRESVTPNFDRLANEGALFTNHHSPNKRSIDGLQSILTGIPPVHGLPSLGFGLEVKSSGNLGETASKNGYDTIFMQTSKRRSYYFDAISQALGFRQYYGMEDYPIIKEYPDKHASVFGWDYDGLMFFAEKLTASKEPFLALFFSGTTHTPFAPMPAEFHRDGATIGNEEGFLSTLAYADASLGAFMEKAAKESWYRDTIFIITGDHTLGKYEKGQLFPDDYNIPLLIYSHGRIEAGRFNKITSHVDVMPTIFELSGMQGEAAIVGSSVFDFETDGMAMINEGSTMGLASQDAWVKVSGKNITESSHEEHKEALARKMWAYQELIYRLVSKGQWAPD